MKCFPCLIILTLLINIAHAQPGTLDLSFANDGKLIDTPGSYIARFPIAVQRDGKIVTGSFTKVQNTTVFRVTRYLSDGSLDTSFGEKGNAYGPISYGLQVSALALQPDGKIVVAGGFDATVARFDADGLLDSTFGTNGITQVSSVYLHYINVMLVQPDGKILLGGNEVFEDKFGQTQSETFAVRRSLPNGKPDESFGTAGKIISAKGVEIESMVLQPDGKIVAGGYNFDRHFYLERCTSDGVLDKGFGEEGSVETSFEAINKPCKLRGIALQKDGKIVATGANNELIPSLLLARYNSDGQLDKTFNDSGKVIAHFPLKGAEGVSVLVIPNNKIVVAGNNIDHRTGFSDFALTCYNEDGSLDLTFGDKGLTTTDIRGGDAVSGAALQPDGKIVVTGNSYTSIIPNYTTALARYNGYPSDKQTPIVRIKRWLQHHGISWQSTDNSRVRYYTVQRSSDGISYKEIAKVNNRMGVNSYEDVAALNNSNNYYRIVAVGIDGSKTYSNAVLIDDARSALIFPNPVRDNLQVQGLPAGGKTNVSIVDWNGNVRSTATATATNYSINTANLNSGSYLLKIQHGATVTSQPFVKE